MVARTTADTGRSLRPDAPPSRVLRAPPPFSPPPSRLPAASSSPSPSAPRASRLVRVLRGSPGRGGRAACLQT
ncbi:unnamed protein product [Spirodela intermedia]|uniref:Uncharacterized protein n=1 Tax=Spirodela intermedia TaxID=51605 RepID=A0A7I8LK74_SPIIN|nr:unnamed protein product [Spirodela intermedia]